MKAFFRHSRLRFLVLFLGPAFVLLALGLWNFSRPFFHRRSVNFLSASAPFAEHYPQAQRMVAELAHLRALNYVSAANENSIHNSVQIAAAPLGIPSPVLWCLLFQESRLNHLSGLEEKSLTTGLGQFSFSAFFEINHQLSRYLPTAKRTVANILGRDVRPISADYNDPSAIHSYYHIPTAVTASALFLHNRYVQLSRIAHQRGLDFSPELLWAWAALSYNKGGRTVLSLWNGIEQRFGEEGLSAALQNSSQFTQVLQNVELVHSAISYIWTDGRSRAYADELITHAKNLGDCSLKPSLSEGSP